MIDGFNLVPSIFAIALAIAGAYFVARSTAKSKSAQVWESESQAQKARGDRLQAELTEEKQRVSDLFVEVTSLKTRPTFEQAMNAFAGFAHESTERWQQVMSAVTELIANHERRAEERHAALQERHTALLEAIAGLKKNGN
jgi:hypothetical protein